MSKNLKSLADRLILLVARLGERATVQNITGRHLVGAEFKQAKQDAAALVVWEPVYQMRKRRPGSAPQRSPEGVNDSEAYQGRYLACRAAWRAVQPRARGCPDSRVREASTAQPSREAE